MSLTFSKTSLSPFISSCCSVGSQCSRPPVPLMLSSMRSCSKDRRISQRARTRRPGINSSASSFDIFKIISLTRSHQPSLPCIHSSPWLRDPAAQRSRLILVSSSLISSSLAPSMLVFLLFSSPSVASFPSSRALFSILRWLPSLTF